MESAVVDFSDANARRGLLGKLDALRGMRQVEIKQYREKHSDPQRRYYFVAYVAPFAAALSEQEIRPVTRAKAHEILKENCLPEAEDIICRKTGMVIGKHELSTKGLDSGEYHQYLERCSAFLANYFGIEVQPPMSIDEREQPAE